MSSRTSVIQRARREREKRGRSALPRLSILRCVRTARAQPLRAHVRHRKGPRARCSAPSTKPLFNRTPLSPPTPSTFPFFLHSKQLLSHHSVSVTGLPSFPQLPPPPEFLVRTERGSVLFGVCLATRFTHGGRRYGQAGRHGLGVRIRPVYRQHSCNQSGAHGLVQVGSVRVEERACTRNSARDRNDSGKVDQSIIKKKIIINAFCIFSLFHRTGSVFSIYANCY